MSDYFERLEGDLRRAAGRPTRRLGPPVGLIGGAVAAVAAVAAAALMAAVVLSGGEQEQGPTVREGPRPQQLPGRVVARGRTPVAGPWRMQAFRRNGQNCVGVSLTKPRPDFIIGASAFCGPFRLTPGFTRGEFWVPARPRSRERILYGRAPERAAAVVVTARDLRIRVKLHGGPKGIRGDFFLTVVPLDLVGRVNWLDADGRPGSRGIRVRP